MMNAISKLLYLIKVLIKKKPSLNPCLARAHRFSLVSIHPSTVRYTKYKLQPEINFFTPWIGQTIRYYCLQWLTNVFWDLQEHQEKAHLPPQLLHHRCQHFLFLFQFHILLFLLGVKSNSKVNTNQIRVSYCIQILSLSFFKFCRY